VVSAIRIFNQNPPALVLIDLKLPSVPGFELCRYVRRDTQFPDVPVVIASAASDKETIDQAMEAEVDVYFAKPINMKELVRTVAALVYNAEAAHPTLVTKRLDSTASLQPVSVAPRSDTLILFVEGHHEPLSLTVQTAVILGRQTDGSPAFGVLDLEPYGAFEKGVSRTHARVKRQGNTFLVDDLGSANGTFINGHSLPQGEARQISSGDELRLGKLRLRVYFLEEGETGHDPELPGH
jgi:CheY-like chemotaxis protein